MKLRRKFLLTAAVSLVLVNVAYSAWFRLGTEDEFKAEWVAYMPTLEEKQRRNPVNLINSSDSHDPDYPILYIHEGNAAYPLFSKIADDCKIRAYTINHYVGPTKTNAALDMPDRFFLGALSREMVSCLKRELPNGYTLARLKERVIPRQTGWGENDLPLRSH